MKLSHVAATLPGSQILAISNTIKERIKSGEKIYNFTVGDFDPEIFPIPAELEEGIINAYLQKHTNYPQAGGNEDLREAIASFTKTFQHINYDAGEVIVGSGGRPLIYALYRTIVDPGDKVIYPVPSWNNHYYTKFVGGTPVEIETTAENCFLPTAQQIAPYVSSAVLLALCSPQNPTGTGFTKENLKSICDMVVEENKFRSDNEKKLYVLFDQMYWLLAYGSNKHYDPVSVCPAIKPYVIYVDAISKSFAATGVRVGWAMGPLAILDKMKAMLTHAGAWAPMAEQKAVASFLMNTDAVKKFLHTFKTALEERLQLLYNGIQTLKLQGYPIDAIEPQGGIYLTIRIDIPDAQIRLLNAGIGVLPFSVFGAPENSPWYRICAGTCKKEDIEVMTGKLRMLLPNFIPLNGGTL
ncbi:MAG: aminotransferase [Chitinophagaceae bacterium]|nr:aminotransferase [Chitinophagaceae bacterium]